MGIFVKAVVAFAIGAAAMVGIQNAWLGAIKERIYSQSATRAGVPEMKPAFTEMKIKPFVMPKTPPIDTRAGQEAAMNSYARQIDQQIRAANSYAPKPISIPGMRR
jgi:hypothetical protein